MNLPITQKPGRQKNVQDQASYSSLLIKQFVPNCRYSDCTIMLHRASSDHTSKPHCASSDHTSKPHCAYSDCNIILHFKYTDSTRCIPHCAYIKYTSKIYRSNTNLSSTLHCEYIAFISIVHCSNWYCASKLHCTVFV